jgi:hypothetical protein
LIEKGLSAIEVAASLSVDRIIRCAIFLHGHSIIQCYLNHLINVIDVICCFIRLGKRVDTSLYDVSLNKTTWNYQGSYTKHEKFHKRNGKCWCLSLINKIAFKLYHQLSVRHSSIIFIRRGSRASFIHCHHVILYNTLAKDIRFILYLHLC